MSEEHTNSEELVSPPPPPPSAPVAHQQVTTTVTTTQPQGVSSGRAAVSTIGNIIWLFLAGLPLTFVYLMAGIFACITVIGIPFGVQSFKLAGYALWPFGRVIVADPHRDAGLSTLGNVIWFIVGGWYLALAHLVVAIFLALTIIGFPLAIASAKMAGLALAPFGKKIVPRSSLDATSTVTVVSSIG